ncbi:hypothetical protein COW46_04635 [Candidatus Gracilibacteria bacterium CG17_big_fil_post_rev_8_21_14_2_50_48_13]|nr:MAG: hypothetical protein COW46_04635 [Candidatus Gracilibacteria bacterium CG17_big_fil_post_rev_8_21_14_2_50_48_13]
MISAPEQQNLSEAAEQSRYAVSMTIDNWTSAGTLRARVRSPFSEISQKVESVEELRESLKRMFEQPAGHATLHARLFPDHIELEFVAKVRSVYMENMPGAAAEYEQPLVLSLPRDRALYRQVTGWFLGTEQEKGFFASVPRDTLDRLEHRWDAADVAAAHAGAEEGKHFRSRANNTVVGASIVTPLVRHWNDLFHRADVRAERKETLVSTGPLYQSMKDRIGSLLQLSRETSRRMFGEDATRKTPETPATKPQITTKAQEEDAGKPIIQMHLVEETPLQPAAETPHEEEKHVPLVHEKKTTVLSNPAWFSEIEDVFSTIQAGEESTVEGTAAKLTSISSRNWFRYGARLAESIFRAKVLSKEFWRHEQSIFLERLERAGKVSKSIKKAALTHLWAPLCRMLRSVREALPTQKKLHSFFVHVLRVLTPKPKRIEPLHDDEETASKRFTRSALQVRGEDPERPTRFMMIDGVLHYTDPKEQEEHLRLLKARDRQENNISGQQRPVARPRRRTPDPKPTLWERARGFLDRMNPFSR